MRCTLEGDNRSPRARSSRATRTLPHSGRSLASASTAALTERAALMPALSLLLCLRVVAVGTADEIRRRVDVAGADVVRVLRIRAERPRAAWERRARGGRRADDARGRNAVLHPVHERRERIDRARRRSAAAMVCPGHEEEPCEPARRLEVLLAALHRAIHLGVPVHHVLRRERAAGLRLPDDELAAALL